MALVFAAAALMVWAGVAQAASRPMIGTVGVTIPGVSPPNNIAWGPVQIFSGQVTTSARTISLPVSQFKFTGSDFNVFPGFAGVAQNTNILTTIQQAAVFSNGGGAAGGGDISFCPAIGVPAGTPPFGTGNTSCTNFAAAGTGNWAIRLGVSNAAGPKFGGTLKLLRHRLGAVWFVPVPPTPSNPVAVVSRAPRTVSTGKCPPTNPDCAFWVPGLTNRRFLTYVNAVGPNYNAYLDSNGAIQTLLTPLGTPTGTLIDASAWGFQMTTGTVSGSDIYPLNSPPTTPSFFFWSTKGTDNRTTTSGGAVTGNIVLVGGGIVTSPAGSQLFSRVTTLEMTVLPEPGEGLSLAASVVGLIGLVRLRSHRKS